MKILQINNYHYLKGGSEKVYFETSSLLEEKGHKVIFFSTGNEKNLKTKYEKYFVKPTNYNSSKIVDKIMSVHNFIYSKKAKKNLEKLILDEKPDIAHLHIFYGHLTSSILPILKKYNIPTVMSIHEYRLMCPTYLMQDINGNNCELCANGNYFNCIFKKCNKGSFSKSFISALECFIRDYFFNYVDFIDKFILVSKFIYNKHKQYNKIPENKMIQLYNFIDINNYKFEVNKGNYYLYVGRLSVEKGIMTLVKAFHNIPNINLKIAGIGPMERDIVDYVKRNNIQNIQLLGFCNKEYLEELIHNAIFTIIPSEWYENNPMSVLESFAYGTPVIGSNIGGIPELIIPEKTGYLFSPGDIEDLQKIILYSYDISINDYKDMSLNARKLIEGEFNKDKYYEELIKIYKSLLSKLI